MESFLLQDNKNLYYGFLDYYKPRVSYSSYETIKYLSRSVIQWFDKKDILMTKVSILDIMDYRKYLNEPKNEKNLCIGSICNYIKMGRKIFRYMVQMDMIQANPFCEVKYPRIPDVISKNILTEVQMNRLQRTLSRFDDAETEKERLEKYRLHVVTALLYSTGMRIAEAAALKQEDIDVKRREIIIRNGKGGKSRIAFISGYVADVLDFYIKYARKSMNGRIWYCKHNDKLFGANLTTLSAIINNSLSKICKNIKTPVITCHGFRHSLGTHLLRAGCDMRHIQMILGHKHLNSTQRYTRVDTKELKNIIDLYHPRQPAKKRIVI